MIFEDIIFTPIQIEELYKPQMLDGFKDKSLPDFNPVTFSSTFVQEVRTDETQKEFIRSYLESAKVLSKELTRLETPRMGIQKVFYNYSLTLPTIYLCRHCMELSIKYAITCVNGQPKEVHGLEKLWSSLLSYLPKKTSGKERSLLKGMGSFVRAIDCLDDTGTKLRYAINSNGNCNQDIFLWANSRKIVQSTELFVKQLEKLKKLKDEDD